MHGLMFALARVHRSLGTCERGAVALAICGGLLAGGTAADAALVFYDFADAGEESTTAPVSSEATGINGSNMTWSLASTNGGFNDSDRWGGLADNAAWAGASNGSLETTRYFEFTLTAESGWTFSLDKLNLDIAWNTSDSTIRRMRLDLRSSLDEYATSITTINPGTPADTWEAREVDLSGLNGGNPLSSIGFRLYPRQGSGVSGSTFYRGVFRDVEVTGTVIPEPASLALLGLGGLLIGWPRRRGE